MSEKLERGYWPVKWNPDVSEIDKNGESDEGFKYWDDGGWRRKPGGSYVWSRGCWIITGQRLFEAAEVEEMKEPIRELRSRLGDSSSVEGPLGELERLLDRLSPPLEIKAGEWYADKHQHYPWSYVLCKKHDDWLCVMVNIKYGAHLLCIRASNCLTRRATPAEVAQLREIVPLGE